MISTNEIRAGFIDYFAALRHEVISSSSLVPENDPTLLFVNAGMVQFKNRFITTVPGSYTRAVSAQKCLRVGGKHNDLDNVGYTTRHHTFFEMLGNFSFGDYSKEEAILYAWNLLTKDWNIHPSRLSATVYHSDTEAYDLWRKISGLPEDKIIKIATSDNFWRMADVGPCGPCSEIFYDHGEDFRGGPPGSEDPSGDRFVEIWNLVFMQFEQLATGDLIPLPQLSVDTGMGLERIAAVLQGSHDNYETDVFRNLIAASVDITGTPDEGSEQKVAHRVVSDHLRSLSFMIADGVLPSNEGRGHILRRILRRAMRHAHVLGADASLLQKMFPRLLVEMGTAYTELQSAEGLIMDVIRREEIIFERLLTRGSKLLEEETKGLGKGDTLSGNVAFKLYDTYGFPLDMTQDLLKMRGVDVAVDEFYVSMERQKAEGRDTWIGGEMGGPEQDLAKITEEKTSFVGYETEMTTGCISSLIKDGREASSLDAGSTGSIVVDRTPFYSEAGGQIGDIGFIYNDEVRFKVTDTRKVLDAIVVHDGVVLSGTLKPGANVVLEVDRETRNRIKANHSSVHLVHEALREILGDHVRQKGSLVTAERMRFDFSHYEPVSVEELDAVEDRVNDIIRQNSEVNISVMPLDQAIAMGAKAMFGEKYEQEVRVVSMGRREALYEEFKSTQRSIPEMPFSVELCGGTHVQRLGDIRLIKIASETGVASGVRRLEVLAGEGAIRAFRDQELWCREVSEVLETPTLNVIQRLKSILRDTTKVKQELRKARRKIVTGEGRLGNAVDFDGVKYLGSIIEGLAPEEARELIDDVRTSLGSGVVAIVTTIDDKKAAVTVGITRDLSDRFDARAIVGYMSEFTGGKGGGRRDMAQAGGLDASKAEEALKHIRDAVQSSAVPCKAP